MVMSFEELPVIYLSQGLGGVEPGTNRWVKLSKQVTQACQTHGCLRVISDHIPSEVYKDIFSISADLFQLPTETKEKNVSMKPFRSYIAKAPCYPLVEALTINGAPYPDGVGEFVARMWPDGNPKALETLKAFFDGLAEVDKILRLMIFEGLKVEKYYDSLLKSSHGMGRLIRYAAPHDEMNTGVPAHEDRHYLTLLYQDQSGGFEIMSRDGSWKEISPMPNSLLAVVGDAFKTWSNDRLHSVRHRVLMKSARERQSFSFFSVPDNETPVTAPEELIDADHPRVFRPYKNVDYLKYLEKDQTAEFALYSYAGIRNDVLKE